MNASLYQLKLVPNYVSLFMMFFSAGLIFHNFYVIPEIICPKGCRRQKGLQRVNEGQGRRDPRKRYQAV